MLRKIEGFLNPTTLDRLRDLLIEKGIEGMSYSKVQGFGQRSQKDKTGKPVLEDRIRVEVVVPEDRVDEILRGMKGLAKEGDIGQGILFVVPVEDALRISTRDAGSGVFRDARKA